MTKCITWDTVKFSDFLRKKGFNARVISNNISRCKRVEKELSIDLVESTKTYDDCLNLLKAINKYCIDYSKTPTQRYQLGGTLRLSIRLFVEYQSGITIPRNLFMPSKKQ